MFIPTKDGSNTLLHPKLNVHYHSLHGALQESLHVFINSGLDYYYHINKSKFSVINIFELGFGTGLNTLLTAQYAIKNQCSIKYSSIEIDPLTNFDTNSFISFTNNIKESEELFQIIHSSEWNHLTYINTYFQLLKIYGDILKFNFTEEVNVIYFDAFAPNAQPELWTINTLQILYEALTKNGVLVSYCAQGQFKRNLKELGFKVESIAGPPGKREMTRAIKI